MKLKNYSIDKKFIFVHNKKNKENLNNSKLYLNRIGTNFCTNLNNNSL